MSDRLLICGVCGNEKPDYDVKTVICWRYGSTYLAGDFYCPFCHCKTKTIIKSSKGTPETGDYSIDCSSNYTGYNRTEYGKGKSFKDCLGLVKQNRKKNIANMSKRYTFSIKDLQVPCSPKIDEQEKKILQQKAADKTQYYRFLQQYGSPAKAKQAFEEWISKGRSK